MSRKTRFIVFDSADGCGKSSKIKDLLNTYSIIEEIKFKKTLPSGDLLIIESEKDFELLFSAFDHFAKSKVYLLDRFVVSNLVYDKILRNKDTSISQKYYEEFKSRFDVLEIFLTREDIDEDFHDDRIKTTKEQFNAIIAEYKKYGHNYELIQRTENGIFLNKSTDLVLNAIINNFIYKRE